MSDFETVCIAMRDDLVGAIPKLSEASQHLFLPWDPENLTAGVGERHLAIWPSAEEAETSEPLATGSHMLNQLYHVQCWEGVAGEGDRLKRDEPGAQAFYELHNGAVFKGEPWSPPQSHAPATKST